MSSPFYRRRGLIIVRCQIFGPERRATKRFDTGAVLALDTGAVQTMISNRILASIGYSTDATASDIQIRTASGIESVAEIALDKIEALDQERLAFPVLAHTLPEGARVDGLLGLDFLREQKLEVDFRLGRISLTSYDY